MPFIKKNILTSNFVSALIPGSNRPAPTMNSRIGESMDDSSAVFTIGITSQDTLLQNDGSNHITLKNQKGYKHRKECDRKTSKCSVDTMHSIHGDLKPTSYWETLTHMIKGNIGGGLLATGMAFKHGGLLFSTILVFILGFMACYNQYILILMANKYKSQYNYKNIGFAETISLAFENGPLVFRKCARLVSWSIKMFITLTQLGFCCVYFLFISQSLEQFCKTYGVDIQLSVLMVFVLPIILSTALIRELKYIVPLSTIANISTFAALGLILYSCTRDLPPISERKAIGHWSELPLCFGTIIYSLEGIGLVLPLQQNMKQKEKFLGKFGVLNLSLSFVTLLIAVIGFFGYYKYGDNVKESLTYNLSVKDDLITQIVISCMVLGILCTYALQFFIPIRLLLPNVKDLSNGWPYSNSHVYEYVLRVTLVLVTFLTAELIPHLDLFVSLVGAIGGSFLALIFSPLADISCRWQTGFGCCGWRAIIAAFSLIIGLFGFCVGTWTSMEAIIVALKKDFEGLKV